MLHAEGGAKRSKSKGNVVLPETVSAAYGIDTARFFLSSLASPDKDIDWSEKGIIGSLRFIKKLFDFANSFTAKVDSDEILVKLNKVINNITHYYTNFEYRKATIEIRELFELINEKGCSKKTYESFLKLLNPICPHVTEEFWEKLGNKDFISVSSWPTCDETKLKVNKKDIDLNEKIIEMMKPSLEKGNFTKVYLYVVPFKKEEFDIDKISATLGKEVKVYAVNEIDKSDPTGKSKKSRPGQPSFYFE